MTSRRTQHILLLLLCFLPFLSANAQKSGKRSKKKQKVEVVADLQDPDPVARKSKPDSHPKPLDAPTLFTHAYDSHTHGIDVSHYQGRVDWEETARDKDVGYVYLKATEGTSIVDDTYRHNFSECKRVGLKVGSYIFFRPNQSAKAQFELFRNTVSTREQDLLPLVDAESLKGVSISVFQSRLIELCELIEGEYGVKPMIYTGQNFYNKNIHGNARLRAYKFFIAKYDAVEPQLNGGDDYVMWQYTARGKVRGVKGFVDQSHFVGRHSLKDIIYRK